MSSTTQRYPLSTPDGISIPFDVIRPSGYMAVNTALTVSGQIAIPAGCEIISFTATEDCIVRFGANAAIPSTGVVLTDAVHIPRDMRITVAPVAEFFTVISEGQVGVLRCQLIDKWAGLALQTQYNKR